MTLPQTLFQVVAILLLVVPGIIFTATRRFLRGLGADEKDFSVRLIHAIAASVIFDCLYLIVAGPWLVRGSYPSLQVPVAPCNPPYSLAHE